MIPEPVGSKSPTLSIDTKKFWLDRGLNNFIVLFCPAQAYPVPVFRLDSKNIFRNIVVIFKVPSENLKMITIFLKMFFKNHLNVNRSNRSIFLKIFEHVWFYVIYIFIFL